MADDMYTLDEGKSKEVRGAWYGAFPDWGPLAEYLSAKLKKGPTKYYRLNIRNFVFLSMHRKLLFS
jgi:hypothetical protein